MRRGRIEAGRVVAVAAVVDQRIVHVVDQETCARKKLIGALVDPVLDEKVLGAGLSVFPELENSSSPRERRQLVGPRLRDHGRLLESQKLPGPRVQIPRPCALRGWGIQ